MGDSEDENHVTFGVALEPLDEENLPRKKPITIEDQFAYDAQGRRRFHGAFTGGFSAGYFNSVGTRDGWRPQQFKSSRSSKAGGVTQRPEDFMDEEDTGEFGIAPTAIRATSEYTDHGRKGTKRERARQNDNGPIPGTPVLKELLRPARETVGVTLLKRMGWKPGQGIGPRVTKKEKTKLKRQNEPTKIYGCALPNQEDRMVCDSDGSDEENTDIMFAPDDYEPYRCNPKDNYFGIGYSGLDRRPVLSGHVNLFDPQEFSIRDKNKKLSIRGQAFGVGAFEADDEDIYARDDMSRYDFSLGPERKSRWSKEKSNAGDSKERCIEGFVPAKVGLERKKVFEPPVLPKDFEPIRVIRKSRFFPPIEPIPGIHAGRRGFARPDLNAGDRSKMINDTNSSGVDKEKRLKDEGTQDKPSTETRNTSVGSNIISRTLNLHGREHTESERRRLEGNQSTSKASWLDRLNVTSFVKGGVEGTSMSFERNLKNLGDFKDSVAASAARDRTSESGNVNIRSPARSASAEPFLADPDKQRRYEQFLIFSKTGQKEKLAGIQPLSMTEWDREREKEEFEQASKMFGSSSVAEKKLVGTGDSVEKVTDDPMKEAARMKMFGKLTRQRDLWQPSSIVCKRFNVAEPRSGCAKPELVKKGEKFSVFDCLDWNTDSKFHGATDTVDRTKRESSTEANNSFATSNSSTGYQGFLDNTDILGKISDKEKNFEVSYEMVFGTGRQQTVPNSEGVAESSSESSKQPESAVSRDADDSSGHDRSATPRGKSDASAREVDTSKESAAVEKKDLFKAIFLSSSEDSDSETEENVDSERVKSVLIGETPTSEINTQRNTSPPRGIFAKLDLDRLNGPIDDARRSNIEDSKGETTTANDSTVEKNFPERKSSMGEEDSSIGGQESMLPDMYGPVLPSRMPRIEEVAANAGSDVAPSQSQKPIFKSVIVLKSNTDSKEKGVWMEKTKVKKSKKEKKKHKHKERSKHRSKSKKSKR